MITGVAFLNAKDKKEKNEDGEKLDTSPFLATSSMDGTVKWFNLSAKGKERSRLEGHEDHILDIAISNSGIMVSAGGDDRYMKVWNVDIGEIICDDISIHAHRDRVTTVAITKDGKCGISGAEDGKVRFFNLEKDEKERHKQIDFGNGTSIWTIALSSDEKSIFVGGHKDQHGLLKQFDITKKRYSKKDEDKDKKFKRNDQITMKIYDGGFEFEVSTVQVLAEGKLLSGGYDKKIMLWDTRVVGETVKPLITQTTKSNIESIAVVPKQTEDTKGSLRFVSGHDDNTAKLWKINEEDEKIELVHTFEGHNGIVKKVAVHPSGKIMATASLDNTWKLWTTFKSTSREDSGATESYRLIYTSHDKVSHNDDVTSVAFTQDGKYLVSGSEDASMCVEDLVHHFEEQPSSLQHNYFESDDKLARDNLKMDWSIQSNTISAIKRTPKRIVEPRWNHAENRNIVHVAAAHGRYDFLKAALLVEKDNTRDIPIKDDTGDIVGHRATGWEGKQKLAFHALVSKDIDEKTPLALACDNESEPSVQVILDAFARLLSQQYATPFYQRDKPHESHPAELFPLDAFCDALEKFPETGLDFVSKLTLTTHQDSGVQRGVSRFKMNGEKFVRGSQERVPRDFWRERLLKHWERDKDEESLKRRKGNPVTAKLVPIKGIAAGDSKFLDSLVKAALAVDDYKAFDNEVVEAVVKHKWERYVGEKFWVHFILFFVMVLSLTLDALSYKSDKTECNRYACANWRVRIPMAITMALWCFFALLELSQMKRSVMRGKDKTGRWGLKWMKVLKIYGPLNIIRYLSWLARDQEDPEVGGFKAQRSYIWLPSGAYSYFYDIWNR